MSEFESLSPDDVVRVDSFVLVKHSPFLASQFIQALRALLAAEKADYLIRDDGFPCQVLRPGEAWQKGKLRIRVEFCPDQPAKPESPLDAYRTTGI